MNISKRCFVRIISFLAALAVVMGVMAAQSFRTANALKAQMEYTMMKNVEDLSANIDNINTSLSKGIYAGTPEMMSQLSAKLWSDAASAKAALSQLPVAQLNLENTFKFLSQVGNYSKSLADRYSAGEELTDEDRDNLIALAEYAQKLSDQMWQVEQKINSGELSFEQTADGIWGSGSKDQPQYVTEGFTDFEEGYDSYPRLIYDGPFSDHILEKEPEMLKGQRDISAEDALEIAKKASGADDLTHTDNDDEQGKMPSYVFSNQNGVSVSVTRAGGYVSYMIGYRAVENRGISANEATERAKKFIQNITKDSVTDTYYEINNNICTINFAGEKDGVILYTDLIKVSVAMDNGEILAYDARGYLTNHTDRDINEPSLSEEDARAKLSKQLNVNSSGLAVIPSSGTNERYCYEFACTTPEGRQMLVYINADTGKEEQILILRISENGTLTV
ncbi:MAG: germination protein YpeB [Eubacterium sp.]|nr:germination protein YpeB [Eubacterium sp.]